MSFQIGDVVRDTHNRVFKVGVVSTPPDGAFIASGRVWAYWKRPPGKPGWCPHPMHTAERDLIPHEDPGPVLADFVAWRFTQ